MFVIVLAACGASDDAAPTSADEPRTTTERLPIEPILFPGVDTLNALQDAYNELVADCMATEGFEFDPSPVEAPPELQNPFNPHRRYGDISPQQAEELGYRNPFAAYELELKEALEQENSSPVPSGYYEALTRAITQDPASGEMSPSETGCAPKATEAIFGNPQGLEGLPGYAELLRVQQESFDRASVEPSVRSAEKGWSDCMLAEGFRFTISTAPLDMYASALDDTSPPTDEERLVAVADADCRDQVELFETYLKVESEIQEQMLEGMQQQVRDLEEQVGAAVRRVAELSE